MILIFVLLRQFSFFARAATADRFNEERIVQLSAEKSEMSSKNEGLQNVKVPCSIVSILWV
jgi:hypothetical protein